MRVCYFGTYRAEYSRNRIMIEGLRQAGVEVIECQDQLWTGIEDRVHAVGGGWANPHFLMRVLRSYLELLGKYRVAGDYDVMVVGYPGQVDVYLARLLTWLRRKPLVWDVFMSIYLISLERGLEKRSRFGVRTVRQIERFACVLPDLLMIDTDAYRRWFFQTYGVKPDRFRLAPTGADERVYRVIEAPAPDPRYFTLVYFGTFIPNHGVLTMVEAAHLVSDDPAIRFVFIGCGPEKDGATALAQRYGLKNVNFLDWLEGEQLAQSVAQSDVCLGVFGTTPQSLMTIQNKIYEAMAMRKPIITGDSTAVREVMKHGEHIYLCERGNPESLAGAIRRLHAEPALREHLAEAGHRLFSEHFTVKAIGQQIKEHLEKMLGPKEAKA